MADNNNDNKQFPKNSKGNGGPNKPDDNFDWSKIIRMVFGWGAGRGCLLAGTLFPS